MTCRNQELSFTECTVVRTGLSSWRLLRQQKPIFGGPLQGLMEWARCLAWGFAVVLVMLGPAVAQNKLIAEVAEAPPAHDGTSAFEIRIQFSAPVKTSYKALRDHSFAVSEGQVTNASRVKKRSDLWSIGIKPASHEAVTITLEGGRACDVQGTVCTK